MKPALLPRLACPACQGALSLVGPRGDGDEVEDGDLACPPCGRRFPVVAGGPRLLSAPAGGAAQVKRAFETQWRAWGGEHRIFGRTEREAMEYLTTNLVHPEAAGQDWRGRWVLDAGCGHGMYVRALAAAGAQVVGLDVSETVTEVYRAVRALPGAHCVQSDVRRPGLRPGVFDLVFANGVIHHTGDTRDAFRRLAALVRAGGYLGVWVYPVRHRAWEAAQRAIRAITTRLPPRLLARLAYVPVPLLAVFPAYSGTSLRTASWRQCAQVVYDFYAPRYQTHHRPDEVTAWFREEGFGAIAVMPDPLSVTGKRLG